MNSVSMLCTDENLPLLVRGKFAGWLISIAVSNDLRSAFSLFVSVINSAEDEKNDGEVIEVLRKP